MKLIPQRSGRGADQLRPVSLERFVSRNAEGSCLVSFGGTRVLCTATVDDGVPGWRRGTGLGWITAEYSMLPRSTRTRTPRERSQTGGRTQEIQRLIGRSARAMVDDYSFGEYTIRVDCDVLEADGGTRTASITGAALAISDAFAWMRRTERTAAMSVVRYVAAVSVGVVGGEPRLDLDYDEDVVADVDMNVVMTDEGRYIEVQGTGEHASFGRDELDVLLELAGGGIRQLEELQKRVLAGGNL